MTLPQTRMRPKATPSLTLKDSCPPAKSMLLAMVVPFVTSSFGVDTMSLLSSRQDDRAVRARAFVAWALRSLGQPLSYSAIAQLLGGKHHSCAIYLHEKAIRLRLQDTVFKTACDVLREHYEDLERSYAN